jgi:hypothetical protein
MRFISFVLLFLILTAGNSLPQSNYSFTGGDAGNNPAGQLNINQDERLNELIRRHIVINENQQGIEGYRIRIFSESGQGARPRATDARARFFNRYPGIDPYLDYDPPNWKVYVGDFRTRSEALKMQKKISRDYPYSFIISSRINLPPLD